MVVKIDLQDTESYDSDDSDDSDIAFAHMDFSGVNFEDDEVSIEEKNYKMDIEIEKNEEIDAIRKDLCFEVNDSKEKSTSQTDGPVDVLNKKDVDRIETSVEHSENIKKVDIPLTQHEAYDASAEILDLNTSDLNVISIDEVKADPSIMDKADIKAIEEESRVLSNDGYIEGEAEIPFDDKRLETKFDLGDHINQLSQLILRGRYSDVLRSATADNLFRTLKSDEETKSENEQATVVDNIRYCVISYCTSTQKCVEVELFATAALLLFIQLNYTGPSLDEGVKIPGRAEKVDPLYKINPHEPFRSSLKVSTEQSHLPDDKTKETKRDVPFQNAVLSLLLVDGEWPCPVAKAPYLLLLSRAILLTLGNPNMPNWTFPARKTTEGKILRFNGQSEFIPPTPQFISVTKNLKYSQLWSARATVAHQRLLQGNESSLTLWDEVKTMYSFCIESFCTHINETKESRKKAAQVTLEWGLAQHHFSQNKRGKMSFKQALEYSGLNVEVTGAEGKRTKYQQRAIAQMLVKATPSNILEEKKTQISSNNLESNEISGISDSQTKIEKQMMRHDEENILLEKVNYIEEKDNTHHELSLLEQTILLALCLDVKNDNPMDGLTGEQMLAFLERVLQQHDDWMVYATALLERAWLECERTNARERAILQIQALADQHSNRLTLTQSTFQSVEDSAPAQERLKNIHYIVYPPRWSALRDLGERYAKLGILTTAAELFQEIELWDEVVECYTRTGKTEKAEEIVRKRLGENETPRMFAALGDLTNDITYYERALEISNGQYSTANIALGKHYFDQGNLKTAVEYFKKALRARPLNPNVWFHLGTISMQLKDWSTALRAFSEVVEQEPEEADAWANVAAVHMHNKDPEKAYPALVESLRWNRNNWRVWSSKLYTCIDLQRYDEGVQACNQLIDMKLKCNAAEAVAPLEEKCVRAIVGGSIQKFITASESSDEASIDSAKRTLQRVRELLSKLSSSMSETWVFEVSAYFNANVGRIGQVLDDLMKEYRAILSIRGWETDKVQLLNMLRVISQIGEIHLEQVNVENMKKFRFLLNGVIKRIQKAHFNYPNVPEEETKLENLMTKIQNALADIK